MPPPLLRWGVRARHARGYLGLNMVEEARGELALVPREDWSRRDVLEARLDLHMAAKEWALLAGFGRQMARRYPDVERGWILWAYALRELERVSEARDVLLEAEPLHGKTSAVLHYNLACYFCLLGELEISRGRLREVWRLDTALKEAALDDPDLAALWKADSGAEKEQGI